ncbi:MAG: YolD-like family protein [Clostridiales bacterium]|nr:YolD-like family protein [Clostridiales bacterium]
MMTRVQRAKQFMPFDAMKGLQEALRDREERHARVERHEIPEEQQRENEAVIRRLKKGSIVSVDYYCRFHDVTHKGAVTAFSIPGRFLKLGNETVFFDDIYQIRLIG